jgi:hypothetical protein
VTRYLQEANGNLNTQFAANSTHHRGDAAWSSVRRHVASSMVTVLGAGVVGACVETPEPLSSVPYGMTPPSSF